MWGLKSFDPVNATLMRSSLHLAVQDRSHLSRISSELVNYYEGNHFIYLYEYLRRMISDSYILETYQKLATFSNVTRLLVDRIATVGRQPIRVLWKDADGNPSPQDQKLWEEILEHWIGRVNFDTWIRSVSKMTELTKTVTARVGWNDNHEFLSLGYYTPNTIDVGYEPGNLEAGYPDRYRILISEASDTYQVWNFASKDIGPSGQVYEHDGAGEGDPSPVEVIDPVTKRSVIPFVTFQTRFSPHEYFVWDGQSEMRNAQEAINRWWTQISTLTHSGAFKMMVLSGDWIAGDGESIRIPTDITKAIRVPADQFGTETDPRKKIWWDGPDVSKDVDTILKVIEQNKQELAAAHGISPKALTASNEPASGYSLIVDDAALRGKHTESRSMFRIPLRRVVELMRLMWDAENRTGPGGTPRKFSEGSTFEVYIPDYGTAVTSKEEVETSALLVEKGLSLRRTKILALNPGISDSDLNSLLVRAGETPVGPDGVPVGGPGMDPLLAPGGDVQKAALMGPQIVGLTDIVQMVVSKKLPPAAAKALIALVVPGISGAEADSIVDPCIGFDAPPAPPSPFAPTGEPQGPVLDAGKHIPAPLAQEGTP